MKPARDVGGDFFDVLSLEDGRIGLVVADVSDKGVPAALFMMSSRTLLKGSAIGLDSPGKVLSEVNQLLQEENDAAMFVTVFYATFDPETGQLAYANGGHNTPLVVHADGSSTVIPPTGGVALGVVPDFTYEESSMIPATRRPRRLVHRRRHRGRKRPRRPIRARAPVRDFHRRDTYGRPRYQRGGFCGGRGLCRRCPPI